MKNKITVFSAILFSFGIMNNALACSEGAIACGNDCAAEGSTCNWEISSTGKLTITGSGTMKANSNRQIAENTASRDTYTTDASYGDYWDKITSVEIGEGITNTGARAFQGLSNVTSVSIPSSLTTIGEKTFDRMSNMNTFTIPDDSKLTTLGEQTFASSGSLGNENAQKILDTLSKNNLANGTTFDIPSATFSDCNLTEIDIPAGVNKIGGAAFRNDNDTTGLTSVTIADGVTTIGNSAFYGNSLTSVDLPDTLTSVDAWAFFDNDLTSIDLPDSLQSIGQHAFRQNQLTSVEIPDSVTELEWGAFKDNNITSVIIGDSLTDAFWDSPFEGNDITYVSIPDTYSSFLAGFGGNPNMHVVCRGSAETCAEHIEFAECLWDGNSCIDISGNVSAASSIAECNSTNYYFNGSTCIREPNVANRTCDYDNKGYVKVGNYCGSPETTYAKKHYTPAEANYWLKDRDNTIILTFKK